MSPKMNSSRRACLTLLTSILVPIALTVSCRAIGKPAISEIEDPERRPSAVAPSDSPSVSLSPREEATERCRPLRSEQAERHARLGSPLDDALERQERDWTQARWLKPRRFVGGHAGSAIALHEDRLYVGHGFGLTIIDVQEPSEPRVVANHLMPFRPHVFEMDWPLLFVGTTQAWSEAEENQSFAIMDVSDSDSPIQRGSIEGLPGVIEIKVVPGRDHVLLAAREEGLLVVDVTDPIRPEVVARIVPDGRANGVAIYRDQAVVSYHKSGLEVIDLSRLDAPKSLSWAGIPREHSDFHEATDSIWGLSVDEAGSNQLLVIFNEQLGLYRLSEDGKLELEKLLPSRSHVWPTAGRLRAGVIYFGTAHEMLYALDTRLSMPFADARKTIISGKWSNEIVLGKDHAYVLNLNDERLHIGGLKEPVIDEQGWESSLASVPFSYAGFVLPCPEGQLVLEIASVELGGAPYRYSLAEPSKSDAVTNPPFTWDRLNDLATEEAAVGRAACPRRSEVLDSAWHHAGRFGYAVLQDARMRTALQVVERLPDGTIQERAYWRSRVTLRSLAQDGDRLYLLADDAGSVLDEGDAPIPLLVTLDLRDPALPAGLESMVLPEAPDQVQACLDHVFLQVGGGVAVLEAMR